MMRAQSTGQAFAAAVLCIAMPVSKAEPAMTADVKALATVRFTADDDVKCLSDAGLRGAVALPHRRGAAGPYPRNDAHGNARSSGEPAFDGRLCCHGEQGPTSVRLSEKDRVPRDGHL
jgi:hypothetical protein